MENDISKILEKVSNREIEKLRRSYKKNKNFNNYLFKMSEKIFRKLVFPYLRFEIFSLCINDVMNNRKYYPSITKYEIEKINSISEKLQNICLNLNCALEEYCAMLLYIDK